MLIIANRNIDKSFNHGLAKEAEKLLIERGHEVKVVDLYKIHFNPLSGPNDFKKVQDPNNFDYLVSCYFVQIYTRLSKNIQMLMQKEKISQMKSKNNKRTLDGQLQSFINFH